MEDKNIVLELKSYRNGEEIYKFGLNKDKLLVGSSEQCDICLQDDTVSHIHAIIYVREAGIEIQDLESTNGILINSNPTKFGFASAQDQVHIAGIPFILEEIVHQEKVTFVRSDEKIIKQDRPAQSLGLKPIEGLAIIDEEYCDIVFDESNVTPLSFDMENLHQRYVDFDENVDETPVLTNNVQKYLQVEISTPSQILSTHQLKLKDGTYFITPNRANNHSFHVDEILLEKAVSLIDISGEQITIHENIEGFELTEENVLSNGKLNIRIQVVEANTNTKIAPFFELDKYFQKINAQTMGAILTVFLLLLLVDTSLPPKPKKVAIIYKLQKPVTKKMKANDPINNNSSPGQNKVDAPPKQQIAKSSAKKKSVKKVKVAKKTPKRVQKRLAKKPTPIKTYKFRSRSIASLMKSSKSIKLNNSLAETASTTTTMSENTNVSKQSYQGLKNVKNGTPSTVSRAGNLNSLGGRGLISKTGVDSSFATTKTVVLGSMDPELLRKILKEYLPQFRQCYQQELTKRNSKLEGVISLDFRIGKSGRVLNSQVRAQRSRFSSQGNNCMSRVLSLIKFPKPRGGGFVDVTQPLNFYAEREVIN